MVSLLLMEKVELLGSLATFISYLLSAMLEVRAFFFLRKYANVCMIGFYYWFNTRIKLYKLAWYNYYRLFGKLIKQ